MLKKILLSTLILSFTFISMSGQEVVKNDSIIAISASPNEQSDSALISELNSQIYSLTSEQAALSESLVKAQQDVNRLNDEVASLQSEKNEIEKNVSTLRSEVESLHRQLINIASNFMYIPYEEYSIKEIAIPSFKAAKESPLYTKHYIRLEILENYALDIDSLIEFLAVVEKEPQFINTFAENNIKAGLRHKETLKKLPLYTRYSQYDDWEETFLGKQIVNIQKELSKPSKETPAKMKAIRQNLEKLIH